MSCEHNKLWRITLDTNPEICNYHCIMCEEHSKYSHFMEKLPQKRLMPIKWIKPIIQQAKELGIKEVIPSTMGEPLLYKEFDEFLECVKNCGMRLNLTTNGSFPGKQIEEWCKALIPLACGSDIKVSFNGATKETSEAVMCGSNYENQCNNIKALIEYRNKYYAETGKYCSITLQLTFMQMNMHELADIVKLACNWGIDRIKGHHLWVNFPEMENQSMKATPESIMQWNKYVEEAYIALEQCKKPLANGKTLRLENIEKISDEKDGSVPEDYDCPFLGRELWISATGKISPCCCPDEKRDILGNFGTFPQTKLQEIVQSEEYRQLCQDYKTRDVCKSCNMRRKVKD